MYRVAAARIHPGESQRPDVRKLLTELTFEIQMQSQVKVCWQDTQMGSDIITEMISF